MNKKKQIGDREKKKETREKKQSELGERQLRQTDTEQVTDRSRDTSAGLTERGREACLQGEEGHSQRDIREQPSGFQSLKAQGTTEWHSCHPGICVPRDRQKLQ